MEMTMDEVSIRCPFCLEQQTILIEPDGENHNSSFLIAKPAVSDSKFINWPTLVLLSLIKA